MGSRTAVVRFCADVAIQNKEEVQQMCESHAYLVKSGVESRIMEDVISLTLDGDQIVMVSLLGEELRVPARIREIAFADHRIVLESADHA